MDRTAARPEATPYRLAVALRPYRIPAMRVRLVWYNCKEVGRGLRTRRRKTKRQGSG